MYNETTDNQTDFIPNGTTGWRRKDGDAKTATQRRQRKDGDAKTATHRRRRTDGDAKTATQRTRCKDGDAKTAKTATYDSSLTIRKRYHEHNFDSDYNSTNVNFFD